MTKNLIILSRIRGVKRQVVLKGKHAIIVNSQGPVLIDTNDLTLLREWGVNVRGRARVFLQKQEEGKAVSKLLSRILMGDPRNRVVDHINHNTLDNRRSNLRVCTKQENHWNSRGRPTRKSKFKGVGVEPRSQINPWVASIRHNKVLHHLGCFKTEKAAAQAYNRAARNFFGEFACLNKV